MTTQCATANALNNYHAAQDRLIKEHQEIADRAQASRDSEVDARVEAAGDYLLAKRLTGSDALEAMALTDELTTALAEHLTPDGKLMQNLLHFYFANRHGCTSSRDESESLETICDELESVIEAVVETGDHDSLLG